MLECMFAWDEALAVNEMKTRICGRRDEFLEK
jgi:hypothetical protein